MGKLIIMSTQPQSPIPPDGGGPSTSPRGPLSTADIQTLRKGLDVIRDLGRMEHAVEVLERTTNSHGERIERLNEKAIRVDFALPIVQDAIPLHAERIRKLERVAHVVEFIIGGTILLFLQQHFAPNLFK